MARKNSRKSKEKKEKREAGARPTTINYTITSAKRRQLLARPKDERSRNKTRASKSQASAARLRANKLPARRRRRQCEALPSLVSAAAEDPTFPMAEATKDLVANGVSSGHAIVAILGMDTIREIDEEDLGSESDSDSSSLDGEENEYEDEEMDENELENDHGDREEGEDEDEDEDEEVGDEMEVVETMAI